MTYEWYREATSTEPITQGDILEDVPVLAFADTLQSVGAADSVEALANTLEDAVGLQPVRGVIMTQACDLQQGHVRMVQLCPALTVAEYKPQWAELERAKGQNTTGKSWPNWLKNIRAGRQWNLTLLNNRVADGAGLCLDHLIVDFHEVFSLPLAFLQNWVRARGGSRLQLRPPYREHLSQAFARYFMRVGLPVDIRLPD